MGTISQLTNPDPSTLPGLLAWLLTEAGWSVASTALVALLIWAWQQWKHIDLSDGAKRVIAGALPFVVIIFAYATQSVLGYAQWSFEVLYEYLFAALMIMLGSQGVFHFIWNPVGHVLERYLAPVQ